MPDSAWFALITAASLFACLLVLAKTCTTADVLDRIADPTPLPSDAPHTEEVTR